MILLLFDLTLSGKVAFGAIHGFFPIARAERRGRQDSGTNRAIVRRPFRRAADADSSPEGVNQGISRVVNLSAFIHFHARVRPDQVAIIYKDQRISYAELASRIDSMASYLAAAGIGPGDVVAAVMKNSAAFLEIAFAVSHVGAVFLPINYRLAAPEKLRFCEPTANAAAPRHHDRPHLAIRRDLLHRRQDLVRYVRVQGIDRRVVNCDHYRVIPPRNAILVNATRNALAKRLGWGNKNDQPLS